MLHPFVPITLLRVILPIPSPLHLKKILNYPSYLYYQIISLFSPPSKTRASSSPPSLQQNLTLTTPTTVLQQKPFHASSRELCSSPRRARDELPFPLRRAHKSSLLLFLQQQPSFLNASNPLISSCLWIVLPNFSQGMAGLLPSSLSTPANLQPAFVISFGEPTAGHHSPSPATASAGFPLAPLCLFSGNSPAVLLPRLFHQPATPAATPFFDSSYLQLPSASKICCSSSSSTANRPTLLQQQAASSSTLINNSPL